MKYKVYPMSRTFFEDRTVNFTTHFMKAMNTHRDKTDTLLSKVDKKNGICVDAFSIFAGNASKRSVEAFPAKIGASHQRPSKFLFPTLLFSHSMGKNKDVVSGLTFKVPSTPIPITLILHIV